VSPHDSRAVRSLLAAQGIGDGDLLIGLGPGAVYGPAKRWPPERFAAIGDRAVERWGARVLLFGSSGEREICRAVTRTMTHAALDLCGRTTLGEAMALIRQCRGFVTNDSGLMHVAAALEVPTVAVFGSTDPVATGPLGRQTVVLRHDLPCSPCLKPTCTTGYRCLLAVEPEEVWEAMERLRGNGP
jgi:heptosyltransferase-2